MITASYVLLTLTALLVIGAVGFVFRNKLISMFLICFAILTGSGAFIFANRAMNDEISKETYKALEQAALEDEEVDVVFQLFNEDKVITAVEYGEIASVYREKTGKEINEKIKDLK